MSLPDTIVIVLLGLVLFGPRKLPEIARQVGKILGELRRASNEFRFQIEEEMRQADDAERRKKQAEAGTPGASNVMQPLPQPPMPVPPEGESPVANHVSARSAEDPNAADGIIAGDGFVTDPQPPAPQPSAPQQSVETPTHA